MANEKIYVGETGAKELYRKVKELIPTDVPGNGKLKVQLGNSQAADTGFTANTDDDHTLVIGSASTSAQGVVQLSNAIDSSSETNAATSKAVKDAYDALDAKMKARAVFFGSAAEWDTYKTEHPVGDPSKVYYVQTGSGEDKYTVYVWKVVPDGVSLYEETDESSISLEGYWHGSPTVVDDPSSTDTFVSSIALNQNGTVSVTRKPVQPVDAYTKAECDRQFMATKKLTGTTTIAGREYKTVTIGNQVWMAENLDMKFDGLTVGSTEPLSMEELRANYYNNDEETYGAEGNKYGLLYNYPAVKYINDNRSTLIPGWHVPTEEEFFTLFRYIGETFDVGTTTTSVETAGLKLKSSSGWDQQSSGETGNGIDAFGMSVIPSGLRTGAFTDIGRVGNLWTITSKPNILYDAQAVHFPLDKHAVIYHWFYGNEFGVRLVKDSDNADDLWRKYDDKEFDAKHSDVAELAKKDINGNVISTTYATKSDVATALGDIETLLAAL